MNRDQPRISNALYLICNRKGTILKILFDDLSLVQPDSLPLEFQSIIAENCGGKASDFFREILEKGFVPDCELHIRREETDPLALKFSGGLLNDRVWIMAARRNKVLEKMLGEMMRINNEQQNMLRKAEKKISNRKRTGEREEGNYDAYDEMSEVNNELMNAQRKLVKKNEEVLRLNKKLQEANRELEHFAYSLTHDLREPLRMVSMFMGLLEEKYKDELDEKASKYIHYAVDGVERMDRFMRELVEYLSIGKKGEQIDAVNPEELLREVVRLNQPQLEKNGGEIVWDSLPGITGYKVPLQQLFNNLISNSLKYRKKNVAPVIRIRCEERRDEWLFSVSDNGQGIDPDYHTEIFEMFRRAGNHPEEISGTGMGLAICKKVVQQHGGEIRVESEPGTGSTFYFTIKKQISQ